jgi:myo-inositol-1-phosphate synthase
MAPTTYSSGYNTPEAELESLLPIHPTAARRPDAIVVQSENTVYTDEHITSTFFNRGANVTVANGQYTVTPTVQPYQFQTTRKVGKTGYVPSAALSPQLFNRFF